MTGKQLKAMLVWEGLFYALGSAAAALVLSVVFGPILSRSMEGIFWFYTHHLTVTPILLLIPYSSCWDTRYLYSYTARSPASPSLNGCAKQRPKPLPYGVVSSVC